MASTNKHKSPFNGTAEQAKTWRSTKNFKRSS